MNLDDMLPIIMKQVLADYSRRIANRVKHEWDSKGVSVPGDAEIDFTMPIMIEDYLTTTIFASGQKAWILEYGSGSLMEKTLDQNPYLKEYFNSEYWNPLRTGYSIRGREEGEYVDLDNDEQYSSGKAKGANLENGLRGRASQRPYIPQEALHIIEEQIKLAIPEINRDIVSAFKKVDLSAKYKVKFNISI